MPTPEKNRAVEVGNPMITGTMNVAPNMATTCCRPMPTVIGTDSRSSGATTVPGLMLRPSPCSFQVNMSLIVTMFPPPRSPCTAWRSTDTCIAAARFAPRRQADQGG